MARSVGVHSSARALGIGCRRVPRVCGGGVKGRRLSQHDSMGSGPMDHRPGASLGRSPGPHPWSPALKTPWLLRC